MKSVNAKIFDGVTSSSNIAIITIVGDKILVESRSVENSYRVIDCEVYTPIKGCPLIINLPDGARLECASENFDDHFLDLILKKNSKFFLWLESHYIGVLTSLLIMVGGLYFFIQHGAPFTSKYIAITVPQNWVNSLDKSLLDTLDSAYLDKSELSEKKRNELRNYFLSFSDQNVKIKFRKGGELEANAFALAGETIIFTDELVNHIKKPDLLLPIFLHELGHIKKRHLVASLVSVTVLNALTFFIIGDMTGLSESLVNVSMSLISFKHSREFEMEADLFSGAELAKNGYHQNCFENSFIRLSQYKTTGSKQSSIFSDYFSTHPAIKSRIEEIVNNKSFNFGNTGECSL